MNDKILIVLMADASTHENEGRALHALLFAKQAKAAGAEVEFIFDGGGVEWAQKFPTHEHFKPLYDELRQDGIIKGVCHFCSTAFEVKNELDALGATYLDEVDGHPNIGKRVKEGWTPIVL